MKHNIELFIGIISLIWTFLFSILMFKLFISLANSCDLFRLVVAFVAVSIVEVIFVKIGMDKSKKEKENGKSDDNKKD